MKKTASLLTITLVLTLCSLSFMTPAQAQKGQATPTPQSQATPTPQPAAPQAGELKPAAELIRNTKAAGAAFARRELFKSSARVAEADAPVRDALFDGATFDLDKSAGGRLLQDKAASLTLPLPDGKGGVVELELAQVNIFAAGFSVTTSKPSKEDISESRGAHYRGIVKGDDTSLAAISVFRNEVMGFYSTEAGGNTVVGRLGGDNPTDRHVLYAEKDLKGSLNFSCNANDAPEAALPLPAATTAEAALARCVRIYIEANYDIFINKGSVANTVSYMTGVFNQAAALYSNEGLPVSLSQIFVWNSPSPYTGLDSLQQLQQFEAVRTTFNGDLAHLVTLQSSYGGIAYVSGLCSTGATYAFSGIDPSFSTVPTYSWTVEVFTHETGHNLGSRHTQACAWNGNNTAIDGCAAPEGTCPRPGLPAGGGTIMSYCHQTAVGINFANGFGTQPRNVILNRFNSVTCLSDCGGGGGGGPANNSFAGAQVITGNSGNVTGSNVGASKETGEPNHGGNAGGASIWYQWQAPASGRATLTTSGSSFDTLLGVYTGSSVGGLTLVAGNDDAVGGSDLTSRVEFNAVGGTTYRIAVDGFGGATGSVRLNWSNVVPAPPNNSFAGAQAISGSSGSVAGSNVGANKEAGEPNHSGNTGGASIWYNWQAPSTGTATLTTAGSNFDTLLGVYAGGSVGALSFVAGNDDDPGVLTSRVNFSAVGGAVYRIAVDGFNGSTGSVTLNWSLSGPPPISVTVQSNPAGRSVTVDGTTYTAPQTFSWTPGSSHAIATTSPQNGAAGTRYVWSSWSDGGAVSHTVAPTAATTYTANFTTQHFLTMSAGAGGTLSPASAWLNAGQLVSISAAPNPGNTFAGWTGSGAGSFTGPNNPASVTMNGPITETAAFQSSPPPPLGRNVALASNGATASASSELDSGRTAAAVINGDRRGLHWGSDPATGSGWHDATANAFPDWVQVNFAGGRTINEIDVFTLQDNLGSPAVPTEAMTFASYGITAFAVQYESSPGVWTTVPGGSVSGNNKVWRRFTFTSITTGRIRVLVDAALAGHSRVVEVEAYESGVPPPPTDAPGTNVALAANGGVASASSTLDAGRAAAGANNGDRRGLNWGAGGGWHDATNNSYPDWLQVDFSGSKTINQINVFTIQDNFSSPVEPNDATAFSLYGVTAFDVQTWNGSAWVTVPGGSVSGNNRVKRAFVFPAVTTTGVRVLVNNALAGFSRLVEVEALTPPARTNHALASNGATASASSELDSGRSAAGVINGDRRGLNWGAGGGWHDATNNSYPDWLQVHFGSVKTISEVSVFTIQDDFANPVEPHDLLTFSLYGVTAFDVQYWNGASWVTVPGGSVTGNNRVKRTFTFSPLSTDRVRVLVNSALAGHSRLAEVEVY